jgi:hypothetical protein
MTSFMASRKQAGFGNGRNSVKEGILERSKAGKELKQKLEEARRNSAMP